MANPPKRKGDEFSLILLPSMVCSGIPVSCNCFFFFLPLTDKYFFFFSPLTVLVFFVRRHCVPVSHEDVQRLQFSVGVQPVPRWIIVFLGERETVKALSKEAVAAVFALNRTLRDKEPKLAGYVSTTWREESHGRHDYFTYRRTECSHPTWSRQDWSEIPSA